MSCRQRMFVLVMSALAWSSVARGQEPASGLGLEAAVDRAIAQEPSLRAVHAEIEVARALRRQAALRPNPLVRVERRDEPGGTDSLTSVGVEWPLDLFRRSGRVETAERSLDQTRLSADDRERLLAADVRLQYGAAAAAIREVAVAEELLAAARQQLDLVVARVEAGRTPPLERDLLSVEVTRLDAARLIAVGRADTALVVLKPLLGMAPTEPLRLRDPLEVLVASSLGDLPAVSTPIADARPDIKEAAARVSLAEARIDQAGREGRVDMSLYGSYMRMYSGIAQPGLGAAGAFDRVRGGFNYVAAGATISIPLLNRNQGQVAAAQAERTGAEARLAAVDLAARAEVAAATVRDEQARRAFEVYGSGVRDLARRNLEVVGQTFELGRVTVFDVLAEQKRFLEIEQGYVAAAREVWEARVVLTRARGETR